MKYYELTCLILPNLSKEELDAFLEKISGFITEESGELKNLTEASKIKLGYTIKNKNEAFLVNLNFKINPEKLETLEKKLKAENEILRYAILTKKESGIKKSKEKPVIEKSEEQISETPETPEKKTDSYKVGLKEIDQKIEEILND